MKTSLSLEDQWNNVRNNYEDGNIDKETILNLIADIGNETPVGEVATWQHSMSPYKKGVMKMYKYKELLHNSIQCPDGVILVSRHQYHFVEHKQSDGRRYSVDGGLVYQRIGYSDKEYINLSCYPDDPHSDIREHFEWGRSYDADMNLIPFKYTKLKDITDDHLLALVKFTKNSHAKKINKVFIDEIEWRGL